MNKCKMYMLSLEDNLNIFNEGLHSYADLGLFDPK